MEGEANGAQEAAQDAQEQGGEGREQEASLQVGAGGGEDGSGYEAQIAERDGRIAELEAQIAEAARTAEAAEQLRGEIADLERQSADDRVGYALGLAGCRNVKAARVVLADYDGDIDKMREAEPWLFAKHAAVEGAAGQTGLPNAGAASAEGKTMKRWRDIAGLSDDEAE